MNPKFSLPHDKLYYFAGWQFTPADNQLWCKQKSIRLTPQLAKLLAVFVANVDVLFTKDELFDILWPNKSVNESSLTRCIAELRTILNDERNSPIYIETIPKKGYRFIQPLIASPAKKKSYGLVMLGGTFAIVAIIYFLFQNNSTLEGLVNTKFATKSEERRADEKTKRDALCSEKSKDVSLHSLNLDPNFAIEAFKTGCNLVHWNFLTALNRSGQLHCNKRSEYLTACTKKVSELFGSKYTRYCSDAWSWFRQTTACASNPRAPTITDD